MSVGDTLAAGEAVPDARPSLKTLLAAVALGTMLAPFNATMVAVAMPEIGDSFGVGLRDVSWIVVGYLIGMATTQPVAGKLGDLFGRRGIFLGALSAFMLASVGAALAPNLPTLVAMRVGQALSSAMAIPNGAALIRQWIPEHRRAAAFGVVGATAGLAAGIGPPVGGAMVALGGWRAMFWFNLPIAGAAGILAWRSFPRDKGNRRAGGFDFRGAVLLAGALTTLALMASAIQSREPWAIFGLSSAALVLGALFIMNERQAALPIISLQLLRVPTFVSATATIFFINMAIYGTLLVLPIFLIDIQGRKSSEVGLVLAALSVPVILVAPAAGRLADRWGRRAPAMLGAAVTAAGVGPFLALSESWGLGLIAGLLAVIGAGLALQLPAIQTAAVESVSEQDAGMAAGVYSTGRYAGSIVGSALLAALIGAARIDGAADVTMGRVLAVFVMVAVAAAGAFVSSFFLRRPR